MIDVQVSPKSLRRSEVGCHCRAAIALRPALGLILTLSAALLAGLAAAATVEVKMTDQPPKYVPEKLTIKVGDTVEWINNAATLHSVTTDPSNASNKGDVSSPAGTKPFDSGFMGPGVKYSYTFTVPGTYKYVCLPHEKDGMIGIVTVKK